MHRICGSQFFALCLFSLVCGLHWQAHSYTFHYDDYHSIVYNAALRDSGNSLSFFTEATAFSVDPNQAMYRPIVLLSYLANFALFGEKAGSFHVFNVIIHAINAVLVFVFALKLGISNLGSRSIAIVFALHSLTTETVYYISSRSESLMSFGVLISLIFYLTWSSQRRSQWYLISLAGGIFAVLSKSVGVIFLPLIFLVEAYKSGLNIASRQLKYFVAYLLVVVIYLFQVWGSIINAVGEPVRSLTTQILTQIKVWVYYLFLLVSPYNLSVEHFFLEEELLEGLAIIVSSIFLVSLACSVVFVGQRVDRLGLSFGLITLIPASCIPLVVILNEHRIYLTIVGFGIIVVALWQKFFFHKRKLAIVTFAVYCTGLLAISCQQGAVWKNEESLWRNAVEVAPRSFKAQLRWADALVKNKDFVGAENAYLHALSLRPGHPAAGNNLGQLFVEVGEFDKAVQVFSTVLQHDPNILQSRLNLAQLFLKNGIWIQAEKHYLEALLRGENLGISEKKLGQIALQHRSDPLRAVGFFEKALEKSPDLNTWISYAVSLRAIGRFKQSETSYKEALKLSPDSGNAWYNLGNLYRDTGRSDEAEAAYKKVMTSGSDNLVGLAREELVRINPSSEENSSFK